MKQLTLLLLLSLFFSTSDGQPVSSGSREAVKALKEQVNIQSVALKNRDVNTFIEYQHPALIELLGGKQNAIAKINELWKKSIEDSVSYLSFRNGEPSEIIIQGDELQCTIPLTMELQTRRGPMTMRTVLVGVSLDKGRKWYFVDTFRKDYKTLKAFLPTLSEKLVISPEPERQRVKH